MSASRPLVSILVPVYNTQEYLPRCLDSLLNQTCADIEILAVNDGSKDGSLAVLQAYAAKDQRVRVFDQPNGGIASTRNLGLKEARGKYFMTCDSDDWAEPQWVETLLRAVSRPGVDLAVCDCVVEEEPGHGRAKGDLKYNYLSVSGKISFARACWQVNCVLWNKIFDLERVRREGIAFPHGREHDDAAFSDQYFSLPGTLLALKGKRLYHYTLRGNSMMGNLFNRKSKGHQFDQLYSQRFVYDWLVRRGYWGAKAGVFLAKLHYSILFCCSCQGSAEDKDLMISKAIELFERIAEPQNVLVSPLVKTILNKDHAAARALLDQPEEDERVWRFLGVRVMRRISSWCSDKIFILGLQIYKQEPFFAGGRRLVFGIPAGRAGKV